MSSRERSLEKRPKRIIFREGPRDKEDIEWTNDSPPDDKMYFHNDGVRYEYSLVSRYEDDKEIRFFYYFTGRKKVDYDTPSRPYYDGK